MEKLTKRKIQAQETKKRLIASTQAILQEKNFQQVTIQEICSRANVSVGTFYLYFNCKEAAVLRCCQQVYSGLERLELGEDPNENLPLILLTYFRQMTEESEALLRQVLQCTMIAGSRDNSLEDLVIFQMLYAEIRRLAPDEATALTCTKKAMAMIFGLLVHYCFFYEREAPWPERQTRIVFGFIRRFLAGDIES